MLPLGGAKVLSKLMLTSLVFAVTLLVIKLVKNKKGFIMHAEHSLRACSKKNWSCESVLLELSIFDENVLP